MAHNELEFPANSTCKLGSQLWYSKITAPTCGQEEALLPVSLSLPSPTASVTGPCQGLPCTWGKYRYYKSKSEKGAALGEERVKNKEWLYNKELFEIAPPT